MIKRISKVKKQKEGSKEFFEHTYVNSLGKPIHDSKILTRIHKLCIPPNWTSVNISEDDTSYLQVSGTDEKGKTQYIYHPIWLSLSKVQKYSRLRSFIEKLPLLMNRVNKKLKSRYDPYDHEYLIALVFRILYKTYSRIGNDCYAEEHNTYGLTTLLKKHLTLGPSGLIKFEFVGKKGVKQCITFKDELCYKILGILLKIPGERLFKTLDGIPLKSNDMNLYLKDILGQDYTCKDFRTYASNKLFVDILQSKKLIRPITEANVKNNIKETFEEVAKELGHTKFVSRKSYVLDSIPDYYLKCPEKFKSTSPDSLLKLLL